MDQNSFKAMYLQRALILTVLLPWLTLAYAQTTPKMSLFVPDAPGISPFWDQMIDVMEAAAENLEIDLKIAHSTPNSYSLKKDGLAVLDNPHKPDYFLSGYWKASTRFHLHRAEQLGIRTFIFNSGVATEEHAKVGNPREKYKHWIGQVAPNDMQAGYQLADILIEKAKAAGKTDNGKVRLIAMGGWGEKHKMEEDRYNGLKNRANARNDAVLDKFILAGWSQDTAYNELMTALEQHSKVTVIWCAGDVMALGAIKAAKDLGMIPGRDIFIGGIDWSLDGMKAIAAGDMTVSMGGHFLEGLKALILAHDYHYGLDFAEETGVETQTQFAPATAVNAIQHLDLLSSLDWHKVDFRQLSKKHNPGLKYYDFSLETLAKNLKPSS